MHRKSHRSNVTLNSGFLCEIRYGKPPKRNDAVRTSLARYFPDQKQISGIKNSPPYDIYYMTNRTYFKGFFMTSLKDARTAKNLTQEELARNSGISLRYYARIEKGESVPSVNVAIQICAALETTVYEIQEWQQPCQI